MMRRPFLISGLLTLAGLLPGVAAAAAAAVPEELQAFYAQARTLAGRFEQTIVDQEDGGDFRQTGQFWIDRPGRYRWEYQDPFPQLIVSDGVTLSVYDPDLEQVTVRTLDGADAVLPAVLLAEGAELGELFDITRSDDDLQTVLLRPKSADAGFEHLEIRFTGGVPVTMLLLDSLGRTTRFEFFDVQRNQPLDTQMFVFEPPPGVDLLRD